MLEKKDVVQKSFRIHRQNDIWLGLLAIKLGRTQNELVNIAIKMLLEDNKRWFFEEFIKATFDFSVHDDGTYENKRLGDTEVEIVPYRVNTEGNFTYLNVNYYKDDLSNSLVGSERIKVDFGPGYEGRLTNALTDIFEKTLIRYPKIMQNFHPGAIVDEC